MDLDAVGDGNGVTGHGSLSYDRRMQI